MIIYFHLPLKDGYSICANINIILSVKYKYHEYCTRLNYIPELRKLILNYNVPF